ncbi:Ig-like domain repeat protein [Methanobrevibacter sp.]
MLKIDGYIFLLVTLVFLLIIIPTSFAMDNETVLNEVTENISSPVSISYEDILTASNDYFFDASAEDDGDGSQANPYKYLTVDRIKANSNLYLADGEYELDSSKNIERVNIYGTNADKTIISYSGVGFRVNTYLHIRNVTFADMTIINYANLTAENTVFSFGSGYTADNYGNNFGGAIYTSGEYPNAYVGLKNCTFENNFAVYGGAIYMGSGTLDIADSLFLNNSAYNYGGAIACENTGSVSISKSKFFNSKSFDDAGGAVYIKKSVFSASNLEFVNSSATFGAAITTLNTHVNLNSLTAFNNSARWNGGAIYHLYGNFTMHYSRFINNSASNGGALFIDNSTALLLRYNSFISNNASISAGAIYSIFNRLKLPIQLYNEFKSNSAYYMNDLYAADEINLSIGNGNYSMYKINETAVSSLPSFYSLVGDGYLTDVKDQQSGGNCWAFTAIAVLESCILKASGDKYDFSEENMKNLAALYSDYGWEIDTNDGGYDAMPWGYLASWLGPVYETDDLTDDKSTLSPVLDSVVHVQDILFLTRNNFTDNDGIKKAILKYGAVGTSMAYEPNYYDSTTNSYYCFSSIPSNHAVTIIGWDDNYSRNNFKWGRTIQGDGAWIVRNSWGPNWGENGNFYISYYDMKLAQPGLKHASYTIILNDTKRYDKNYQYDVSGKTDVFLNSTSSVWYKNVFVSAGDEFLAAVSTYFDAITNWTVSIKVNGELKLSQSGISNPGYFTIDLNQLIRLSRNDVFEVIFNITVGGEASFPISEYVSLNKLSYSPEVSYASWDGINWVDLYDLSFEYSTHRYNSQVACIKAFTILNPIETVLKLNISSNVSNHADIIASVVDQYGNLLTCGNVTFNVNGIENVVNVSNGVAILNYTFNKSLNHIEAIFEATGYSLSFNETLFEIEKTKIDLNLNISRLLNNVTLEVFSQKDINETLMAYINENEYEVKLINGKAGIVLANLSNDVYAINVNLLPDSLYESDGIKDTFAVNVHKTRIIASNLTFCENETGVLNVTLIDDDENALSGRLIEFYLNDYKFYGITDENGQSAILVNLNPGNYTCNVVFEGDNNHFKSDSNISVEVKPVSKKNATVVIDIGDVEIATDVQVHVNVLNSSGQIYINVDGNAFRINLNDNGSADFVIGNVTAGRHVVDVVYLGDDVYDAAYNSVVFEVLKSLCDIDLNWSDVCAGEDVDVAIAIPGAFGNVSVIINGFEDVVALDENGTAVYTIPAAEAGDYGIVVVYHGDETHEGSVKTGNFTVEKKDLQANITLPGQIHYGDDVTVTVSVPGAAGNIIVSVDGNQTIVDLENGVAQFIINNIAAGNHIIDAIYEGDKNHNPTNSLSSFYVEKAIVNIDVSVPDDVKAGDNLTVDISVSDDGIGELLISSDMLQYDVNGSVEDFMPVYLVNGTASVTFTNVYGGRHSVYVTYRGDANHNATSAASSFFVEKLIPEVSIAVSSNIKAGDSADIYVSIPDVTGNVSVVVDGVEEVVALDENGSAVYTVPAVGAGGHGVVVVYPGDDIHDAVVESVVFSVDKEVLVVNVTVFGDFKAGGDVDVNVSVPGGFGNVSVVVDGVEEVVALDENGSAVYTVPAVGAGGHGVVVVYPGDDIHDDAVGSSVFTVEKEISNVNVTVGDVTSGGADVTVSVPGASGNVSVVFDGVEVSVPLDANGTATYNIPEVTGGEHSLVVIYDGDETHSSAHVAKTVINEEYATRFANITVADGKLTAVLVLSTGEGLANVSVRVNIGGVIVNAVTDENGALTVDDVMGKSVELKYEGNDSILPADISVDLTGDSSVRDNTAVVSSDFEQYACDYYEGERGGNFTFQLTDSKGNVLANKTVFIGYNGVTYNRTTDENGYAALQINLKNAGIYTFVIVFLGDEDYNASMAVHRITINKKPITIAAPEKTFKAGAKTKKYTVTLKTLKGSSADGKTYLAKGKKVTLTINAKTYTAKTNAKGQATFKISLTKKGSYSAVVNFDGDNTYSSNRVNSKIKIN